MQANKLCKFVWILRKFQNKKWQTNIIIFSVPDQNFYYKINAIASDYLPSLHGKQIISFLPSNFDFKFGHLPRLFGGIKFKLNFAVNIYGSLQYFSESVLSTIETHVLNKRYAHALLERIWSCGCAIANMVAFQILKTVVCLTWHDRIDGIAADKDKVNLLYIDLDVFAYILAEYFLRCIADVFAFNTFILTYSVIAEILFYIKFKTTEFAFQWWWHFMHCFNVPIFIKLEKKIIRICSLWFTENLLPSEIVAYC